MRVPMTTGRFGEPMRRVEDVRLTTGKGRYVDDLKLNGMVHAAFVRSPHAHAKILLVDPSDAVNMPGVLTVLTGDDMRQDALGPLICGWALTNKDGTPQRMGYHPALAHEVVRYVGDAVAIVIAETRNQADDAAEMVLVEYEDLPVLASMDQAMSPDAAQLHPEAPGNIAFDWEIGDRNATDAAFAAAAHVARLSLRNNRLVPNAMEPRACIAIYDRADEQYTLYLTSQCPHIIRTLMTAVIGFGSEHKFRVISPDVGGGFGSKAFNYPEEVAVTWAAKKLGIPVKWTCSRSEAFLTDAHGRDHRTHVELALDANNMFLGLRVSTSANMGAYLSTFATLVPTYMSAMLLSGQYVIPAIYCEVKGVYTNTTPVDAYRGAGRPEASFALERIIEIAARELNADRVEIRRKNFIRSFPYQTPVIVEYDVGDFDACLDMALNMSNYAEFPSRKAEAAARGKLRGIGVVTYIEAAGSGPSGLLSKLGGNSGMWESAEVRVNPTGSVDVLSGTHSHGQSHATTFAQLVATRFGIHTDQIRIVQGDTDKVQAGVGTFGSRSGPVGMTAIDRACAKVIEKGKQIAAYVLDVPYDTVDFSEGLFTAPATNRTIPFAELAYHAHAASAFPTDIIEPGLQAHCFFDPPNFSFPAGTYICEVEVDPETGVTSIVDFVAADDFGAIANPMVVHGQVHGGLAQGIGQALMENAQYDLETGQLLTGSFMDYCMPRADDLPFFKVDTIATLTTTNDLGMKGCGEAGAIGAPPAVINALLDAIGKRHIEMPATPQRVWEALNAADQ